MNILVTGCNGQLGNEMQLLEEQFPENIYYNELDINEFNAGKKRLMALGVPEDHFTNFDVLSKEFEEYYNK